MSNSESYLTAELVEAIMSEYEWPEEYVIEGRPPWGVRVDFPDCRLFFTDGADGEIEVGFRKEDTGADVPLTIWHAIDVIKKRHPPEIDPVAHGWGECHSPFRTPEATTIRTRNSCLSILAYLKPVLLGDFSWVSEVLEKQERFRVSEELRFNKKANPENQ